MPCRGRPACPPPLFHLRVLRVLRGLLLSVSSVFSVVCLLRALRPPLYYQPVDSFLPARVFMPRRERVARDTTAARLATPLPPWSKQSCLPHRMSAWSKPPGFPHRPLRGARSLACHAASLGGGWLLPRVAPLLGRKLSLWASLFLLWCRPLLWGRLSSLRPSFMGQAAFVGQASVVGQAF